MRRFFAGVLLFGGLLVLFVSCVMLMLWVTRIWAPINPWWLVLGVCVSPFVAASHVFLRKKFNARMESGMSTSGDLSAKVIRAKPVSNERPVYGANEWCTCEGKNPSPEELKQESCFTCGGRLG